MDHGEKMFKRGHGWHGTGTTVASGNYGGVERESTRRAFKSAAATTYNLRARRTGGDVVCMAVRNVASCVLRPKSLVSWKAGSEFRRVDGYAFETAQAVAGVVDEFWPSGGVPVGELFWLQIQGPTLMITPEVSTDGVTNDDISALDHLVAASAGSSAGATVNAQGRVAKQSTSLAHSASVTIPLVFKQLQNRIGRALSAKTTAQTAADILVNLEMW